VDDSLGRLRRWLTDHGLAENTVVILMGDNGFLFGEHGLIDKRNAYEESMRVPLLVAAPGMFEPGQVLEQMVANIDIAPTLLTLAGVDVPEHYDGASFAHLPRLQDPQLESNAAVQREDGWRETLAYEYYWEFNYPQTPTVFALRTPQYKYIQYHGVWDTEELFDLRKDPQEANNLIEDPALLEVKVGLRRQLYAALADRQGRNAVPFTEKFNQGAVFRHADRSKAAEFPPKWLRRAGAPDRWEHVIPDGPDKAQQLKIINEALKDR
jgi:arylsulfatase A-like enzyme